MEIQSFLELCTGTWFSQRTRYQFDRQTSESHKSELTVEYLSADHPDLAPLYAPNGIAPDRSAGALKVSWNTAIDWNSPKQVGTTTLIFIADTESSGKLLRIQQAKPSLQGSYSLGSDDALTLTLQEGTLEAQERIWFASENLRLRTTVLRQDENSYCQTAFYSEIRKLQVPPAQ